MNLNILWSHISLGSKLFSRRDRTATPLKYLHTELSIWELQTGKKPLHHECHHQLDQGHAVKVHVINFPFKTEQMVIDISEICESNQTATVFLYTRFSLMCISFRHDTLLPFCECIYACVAKLLINICWEVWTSFAVMCVIPYCVLRR